jgi:leucyl-tRNA synthetase
LWRELKFGEDVMQAPWPEPDRAALEQDEVEYVLQVNGKKRGSFLVPRGASEKETAALAISAAQNFLGNQKTKKEIVVPGRLVNLVV